MDKSGLYPTYRSKLNHLLLLLSNLKSVHLKLKKKLINWIGTVLMGKILRISQFLCESFRRFGFTHWFVLPAGGGQLHYNGLGLVLCSSHLCPPFFYEHTQLDCLYSNHDTAIQCQTKSSRLLTEDNSEDKGNKVKGNR